MSIGLTLSKTLLWEVLTSRPIIHRDNEEVIVEAGTIELLEELIYKYGNVQVYYAPLELIISEQNIFTEDLDTIIDDWLSVNIKLLSFLEENHEKVKIIDLSRYSQEYFHCKDTSNENYDFDTIDLDEQTILKKMTVKALTNCYTDALIIDKKIVKYTKDSRIEKAREDVLFYYDFAQKKRLVSMKKVHAEIKRDVEAQVLSEKTELKNEIAELNTQIMNSFSSLSSIIRKYELKIQGIKRGKISAKNNFLKQQVLSDAEVSKENRKIKDLLDSHAVLFNLMKCVDKIKNIIRNRILKRNEYSSEVELLKSTKYFNLDYYYSQYPDVKKSGINPYLHYLEVGYLEGRKPSSYFDGTSYMIINKDVAKAGINPLIHYLKFGKDEGRRI